jgi:hypothetical protein
MSLEATHIRFALDIIDRYEIDDVAQYISGAVYPDSRYMTRIDRQLTHHADLLLPSFADTDFKKGWQSHYLCDALQNKIKKTVFPEIAFAKDFDENDWVVSTAIKIIEDIDDMQRFDLQACLPALDYAANPNGENLARVREYNQVIRDIYLGKAACEIDDYRPVFQAFGIGQELADRIIEQAKAFRDNKDSLEKIRSIYDLMIAEATA